MDEGQAAAYQQFSARPDAEASPFAPHCMGLEIVARLVALLKGDLSVPKTERGVSFEITLPIVDAGREGARAAEESKPDLSLRPILQARVDVPAPRLGWLRYRVAIVEDSVLCQKTLAGMFRSVGCQSELFDDGQTAIDAISARPQDFQLVLTDETMPGLSGFQVAASLKGNSATSRIPILYASGNKELTATRLAELGFASQVTKPYNRLHLLSTSAKAIDAWEGNQEAAIGETKKRPSSDEGSGHPHIRKRRRSFDSNPF